MVPIAVITVVLLDSTTVVYNYCTLTEVVQELFKDKNIYNPPLLIKVGNSYNLYFNKELFAQWQQKEMDLKELLEYVKISTLVRNKSARVVNGFQVPEGSLWLVKNNLCILANNDNAIITKMDNGFKLCF